MGSQKYRAKRKKQFLSALRQIGLVSWACKLSRVPRRTVYFWLDNDITFKQKFDEIIEVATELAEAELYRRAVEGVDRPIVYKGKIVGTYKEYSDSDLIFLLKARKPEVYRDRRDVKHKHEAEVIFVDDS